MRERWTIFLQCVDVLNLVGIIGQEQRCLSQEDDSGLMITGAKSEGDTERFHRTRRRPRIFRDDNGNFLSHADRQAARFT